MTLSITDKSRFYWFLCFLFLKRIEMFWHWNIWSTSAFFNSFIMRNRKGLQVNHVKQSSKVIRVVRSELQNSPGSSSELQSPVSKSGTYYKSQISGKENSLHCWLQCTGASKRISCQQFDLKWPVFLPEALWFLSRGISEGIVPLSTFL